MEAIRGGFAISARLMLGGVFLLSGIDYSCGYTHIVQQMAAYGTPYPRLMLLIGILLLLAGSTSVILGYRTRLGAGMLLLFLLGATYFFYDIWDPSVVASQNILRLSKDGTLMGAMAMLMLQGAGPWSIDASPMKMKLDGMFVQLMRLRVRIYLAPPASAFSTAVAT